MADPNTPAPRRRIFQPLAGTRTQPSGPGYDIKALASSGAAEVWLYDEIGGWGVEASTFVRELMAIDADQIDLHVHSPGGSAYDGMAIYQALRNHKARVTVYVDGLAASAAGFIALAGDRRIIAPHATVMVHDPWGITIGSAADMDKACAELDKLAGNMAALYARRSGGDVADWREAMRAESWYTAEEAVAAGLMHEVQEDKEKPEPDERAKACWDLGAVFAYAGRGSAPPPRIPAYASAAAPVDPAVLDLAPTFRPPAVPPTQDEPTPDAGVPADPARPDAGATEPPAAEPGQPTEENAMSLDKGVRERLGLAEDADEEAVMAALDAALRPGDPSPAPDPEPDPAPEPQPDPEPERAPAAVALPDGVVAIDAETLAALRRNAELGAAAHERQRVADRDREIQAAMDAGKFAPARRDHWVKAWEADPEGTKATLDTLEPGLVVPIQAAGHTGRAEPETDELAGVGAADWAAQLGIPAEELTRG